MTENIAYLISLGIGAATLALSTYLGISRNVQGFRMKRSRYLFAMLFILLAMWIGGNFVAVILAIQLHITADNFERSRLIMQLVISAVIGIPGLTALLHTVSGRCRDAGYRPSIAYLGAIPLLQMLFWIWLLFPRSVVEPQTATA
ncbi:MAG: hypothetical protein HYU58_07675 [Proteobacteria bacterium]|nr:hypothetical protein [Pseudomonadota bacterium]